MEYEDSLLQVASTVILIEWLKNAPDADKIIADLVEKPNYRESRDKESINKFLHSEVEKAKRATSLGSIIEEVLRHADLDYVLYRIVQ